MAISENPDTDESWIGTPEQLKDPNYFPPLRASIPLGIQHVFAMFISNITPAIIIAGAAGFGMGSGSPDFPSMIYMIQMCMLLAGATTLLQTVGLGPVGARLPIVQGTSFAFIPIFIPLVEGKGVEGMAMITGGILVGGLFQACLAPLVARARFTFSKLVTGLVVTMIGLSLLKVGITYAAGGAPAIGDPEFGSLQNFGVAGVVVAVTVFLKFYTNGMLKISAVLMGLVVGYLVAAALGMVSFENLESAAVFAVPKLFPFGIEFGVAAVLSICMMAFISTIETYGDVSGIAKGGADREATASEIRGATFADGLGTAFSSLFGALPNTTYSQNVGLIAITGVMSRHVVTCGAVFLILCGFIPKVGAVISTIPTEVLGGGLIVTFGMVVSAGVKMLADVEWNSRNMVVFAVSISIGVGCMQVPEALVHLPATAKALLGSGLLPAAVTAIGLSWFIPERDNG